MANNNTVKKKKVKMSTGDKVFTVINTAIYMLCFLCLQINVGGFAFTMTVLGFTVVYIAAALILVYRRAPRSFRVK